MPEEQIPTQNAPATSTGFTGQPLESGAPFDPTSTPKPLEQPVKQPQAQFAQGNTSKKSSKMDKKSKIILVVLLFVLAVCVGVMVWLLSDKFSGDDVDGDVDIVRDDVSDGVSGVIGDSGKEVEFPDLRLIEENFLPLTDYDREYGPAVSYWVGSSSSGLEGVLRVTLSTVMVEQLAECSDRDGSAEPTLTGLVNYTYLDSVYRGTFADSSSADLISVPVEGINADEVVDVMVAALGQDISGTFVLFLMRSGTVEYTPIQTILDERKIRSLGQIPGVENVIGLEQVSSSGCVGGQLTVIAHTINGKFYDLGSWATTAMSN